MSEDQNNEIVEQWKDIPGYEGLYQASSLGKIRSLDHWGKARNSGFRFFRGKIINAVTGRYGYLLVSLSRDGKVVQRQVHCLVITAFVGDRPDGMDCCHLDGTRINNRVENLRWDTRKSNREDMRRHGTLPKGENVNTAILIESEVLEIRERSLKGERRDSLAIEFGVSKCTVDMIVTRRSWKHL